MGERPQAGHISAISAPAGPRSVQNSQNGCFWVHSALAGAGEHQKCTFVAPACRQCTQKPPVDRRKAPTAAGALAAHEIHAQAHQAPTWGPTPEGHQLKFVSQRALPPPSAPFSLLLGASGCIGGKRVQPTCNFGALLHPLRLNAPRTAVLAVLGRISGRPAPKVARVWPAQRRFGPQSSS